MVAITEEIAHMQGVPQKLIVFLHGYIDSDTGLERVIGSFTSNLKDTALHIPQAPLVCELHEHKRQWYSMHRFDPNDDRKTVPSMEECSKFYNKMQRGFAEANAYLQPYIENLLNEYQLEEKDLYLCGFSQGAMLALYSSLMMEKEIGGCVSFSGILAASNYVEKHIKSRPQTLLIHGDADNLVRFEALNFTEEKLKTLGVPVKTYIVKKGQHRITEDGLKAALKFINKTKGKERG